MEDLNLIPVDELIREMESRCSASLICYILKDNNQNREEVCIKGSGNKVTTLGIILVAQTKISGEIMQL
jgi:hypothetical protein